MLKWRELETEERREWYSGHVCRDFPANEVKPLEMLESLCSAGSYRCWLFYEEPSIPVGYAYLMTVGRFTLLDYLAIEPELRGKGYGSKILAVLTEENELLPTGNTLLIEAENPACAVSLDDRGVRLSRVHFYQNAGMRMTEVLEKTFGVDYRILTGGETCSDREAMNGLTAVYREMLPETAFRQNYSVTLP